MEKGDKMNENPFVLAASTDERSKAPLCMATTCCSILPLPFTGRRVPSRPRHNKREKRQNCLLWVQFKTQSKQGRVSREKISVSFKKPNVLPTLQAAIFHCVSNYLSLSMDYPQVFENGQQRDYNDEISKWLDLEQGSKMDDGVGASKRIGG